MTKPLSYEDGTEVKVGDRVTFSGGHQGVIALIIGHPEAHGTIIHSEWDYLKSGLIVESQFGLIHYEVSHLSMLDFISRSLK